MKKIFVLFLFSLSLYSDPVFHDVPLVKNSQQETMIPDPCNLKSDWWSYFNIEPMNYQERIENFSSTLLQIQRETSSEHLEKIQPLIRKIINGFKTLSDLKKKPFVASPPPFLPKGKSLLENFLQFGNLYFENNNEITQLRLQTKLENSALKADEKNLDTLTAAYLISSQSSSEHLFHGLEIIDAKINLEIDQEQFNRNIQVLENKLEQFHHLEEEINGLRKNLIFSEMDLKVIEEQITAHQKNLNKVRERINNAQAYLVATQDKTRFTDLDQHIASLQFLIESIYEASDETVLDNLQLQHLISSIETKKEQLPRKAIYQHYHEWQEERTQLIREISDWQKEAQLRLQRSLHYLGEKQYAKKARQYAVNLSQQTITSLHQLERESFLNGFLLDQFSLLFKERHRTYSDVASNWWYSFISFVKTHASWFEKSLFKLGKTPITPYAIIKFFFIAFLSYILARLAKRSIKKIGKRQKRISDAALYTLSRLTYYLIFGIGIIIAITTIGIDFTAFAFIAGALTVGIGFGLQSIFNNFVAGIIVLLEKNIRIGDVIKLESGEFGTVQEIKVRTTLIRTFDNLEILIPNSELVSKKFTNWTLSERYRRLHVPFSVAFNTDKEFLRKVIVEAVKKVPTTLSSREPDIWLMKLGESGLDFELVVWINEYAEGIKPMMALPRYLWVVETALRENHIQIPYPVRDVHIKKE